MAAVNRYAHISAGFDSPDGISAERTKQGRVMIKIGTGADDVSASIFLDAAAVHRLRQVLDEVDSEVVATQGP